MMIDVIGISIIGVVIGILEFNITQLLKQNKNFK